MIIEDQSNLRSTEIIRSFGRVNNSMRKTFQRTALDNELSLPQLVLLMTIAPKGEITQKQLGKETQFPKSTLSQAVDGLVQTELITRHPVEENRREMKLTLSNKGKALYEKTRKQEGSAHQVFESAIKSLTENQCDELLISLRQIAMFLENELIEKGE